MSELRKAILNTIYDHDLSANMNSDRLYKVLDAVIAALPPARTKGSKEHPELGYKDRVKSILLEAKER